MFSNVLFIEVRFVAVHATKLALFVDRQRCRDCHSDHRRSSNTDC